MCVFTYKSRLAIRCGGGNTVGEKCSLFKQTKQTTEEQETSGERSKLQPSCTGTERRMNWQSLRLG